MTQRFPSQSLKIAIKALTLDLPFGLKNLSSWRYKAGIGLMLVGVLSGCGEVRWLSPQTGTLSADSQTLLSQINLYRAKGVTCGQQAFAPAGVLRQQGQLVAAAQYRAADMAATGDFSHTPQNGKDYQYWLREVVWNSTDILLTSENLTEAQGPSDALKNWLASPQHCQAIFTGGFNRIGLGETLNPTSGIRYWVLLLTAGR